MPEEALARRTLRLTDVQGLHRRLCRPPHLPSHAAADGVRAAVWLVVGGTVAGIPDRDLYVAGGTIVAVLFTVLLHHVENTTYRGWEHSLVDAVDGLQKL